MCLSKLQGLVPTLLGGGKQDNSAAKEAARARMDTQRREDEKTARIGQGRQSIDAAFGQFDDPYFQNFQDTYKTNFNTGLDESNRLKSEIEQQRAALYQTNQQAADPATIATQATGAATALKAPREFGQLGQIFADFLGPIGAGVAADRNSANPRFAMNKQPQVYSRAGSGRVVS
jgi:hypothetical protein